MSGAAWNTRERKTGERQSRARATSLGDAGWSRQAGLTLTELLISVTLGMFLVAGVINVFLGGLTTFRTNDALARIQESGRYAMEVLRRDLRQAGYFGCRQSLAPEVPRTEGALTPGFIRNTLNPAPTPTTDLLAWDYGFGIGLGGFSAVDPDGGSGWVPAVPANSMITGALDHSDMVVVSGAKGAGLQVRSHPGGNPPGSAAIILWEANHGLQQDDVLMVTDCTSGAVFNISAPPNSASLQHNTGTGTPGNWTTALGRSFAGADVFRIEKSAYYVANGANGRPALFRNDEELVEDVERLRVFFGIDQTGDRSIDEYLRAGVDDGDGDRALDGPAELDADWEEVIAVQIHLLISSGEGNNLTEQSVTVPFAGGTFTAPDRRLYQSFTATVAVRNRLP